LDCAFYFVLCHQYIEREKINLRNSKGKRSRYNTSQIFDRLKSESFFWKRVLFCTYNFYLKNFRPVQNCNKFNISYLFFSSISSSFTYQYNPYPHVYVYICLHSQKVNSFFCKHKSSSVKLVSFSLYLLTDHGLKITWKLNTEASLYLIKLFFLHMRGTSLTNTLHPQVWWSKTYI
jgi:hypothetical protein